MEVDAIKLALANWINSQDLSPNYGAAAMAELTGLLIGQYSNSWEDVMERLEIMQGLMSVAARATFRAKLRDA